MRAQVRQNHRHALLLLIWLAASSVNLWKAYHIDDTVHLETAQWILKNPLHPMSGKINWDQSKGPISLLNQPHLYFYMLALWGKAFGFSEFSMHLLQSAFMLACIALIYSIAEIIVPTKSLYLTAILGTSPALVVGQNLMTDIPLLSAWLFFYYLLLSPKVKSEQKRLAGVGLVAGLACLIKYISLALLPVMILHILTKRRFYLAWTILIPVTILALWSYFNYLDCGIIHITGRPRPSLSIDHITRMSSAMLLTLGAVMVYSPVFFAFISNRAAAKNASQIFSSLLIFSGFIVILLASAGFLPENMAEKSLPALFYLNATGVSLLLLSSLGHCSRALFFKQDTTALLIAAWVAPTSAFIIAFAPFMAVRHVMLVVVPLTFALAYCIDFKPSSSWAIASLSLSISISFFLGISDLLWANYFRDTAALARHDLPANANIYFTGHWGWQWYAEQNGMQQLDSLHPQIHEGDYLVFPKEIHQQRLDRISSCLELKPIRSYSSTPSFLTLFRTDRGRFYSNNQILSPWGISRLPFGNVIVFKIVIRPKQESGLAARTHHRRPEGCPSDHPRSGSGQRGASHLEATLVN
jgi:Dolichyl-phosphate-mannose-protein mannosyltransferase